MNGVRSITPDALVAVFVGCITERQGVTDLLQAWLAFDKSRDDGSPEIVLLRVEPDSKFTSDFVSEAFALATSPRARDRAVL